jgi:hypothetical protein
MFGGSKVTQFARLADGRLDRLGPAQEVAQIGAANVRKQTFASFKEKANSSLASEVPHQGEGCSKLLTLGGLWIVPPSAAPSSRFRAEAHVTAAKGTML